MALDDPAIAAAPGVPVWVAIVTGVTSVAGIVLPLLISRLPSRNKAKGLTGPIEDDGDPEVPLVVPAPPIDQDGAVLSDEAFFAFSETMKKMSNRLAAAERRIRESENARATERNTFERRIGTLEVEADRKHNQLIQVVNWAIMVGGEPPRALPDWIKAFITPALSPTPPTE